MGFQFFLVGISAITLAGIGLYVRHARTSPRKPQILSRFSGDLAVLKHQRFRLALYVLIIGYIQSILGRNLAFYLHHPLADYVNDPSENLKRHRLYDLGYSLLPDFSESESIVTMNEFLQYVMAAAIISISMTPYLHEICPKRPKSLPVFTVNIVIRLLQGIAIGHVLRIPTFLATSLPGPSPHCIGEIERHNHPHDLAHIFWFPHTGANCGDLVFSGHVLFATTAVLTVTHYVHKIFGRDRAIQAGLALLPVYLLQIILIIMSRAHYSVDVVSSMIISTLSWIVQAQVAFPLDVTPEGENLQLFPSSDSDAKRVYEGGEDSSSSADDAQRKSASTMAVQTEHSRPHVVYATPVTIHPQLAQFEHPSPHTVVNMGSETPRRPWSVVDGDLPLSHAQSVHRASVRLSAAQILSTPRMRSVTTPADIELPRSMPVTPQKVHTPLPAFESPTARPGNPAGSQTTMPERIVV